MRWRSALIFVVLPLVSAPAVGCANRSTTAVTEVPAPPARITDLDTFEQVLNRYALLDESHEQRQPYRKSLSGFLLRYIDDALDAEDEDEALSGLRYAVSLYTPAELRTAPASPALARRAHGLYRLTARRGAERPSLLALAIEQRFGDEAARSKALENWEALEGWLVRNGPYSTEPLLRHEELERALEEVAATFPSPFVTRRLADLYVARYDAARKARMQGRAVGTAALRRMEVTGYLLMRAYLRADDLRGAAKALERVQLDPPVAKLREIMVDAIEPRRSALPILALAQQFVPEPDEDPEQAYVRQGWGIAKNLSRRAIRQFPKDAFAHLLRARTLANEGLDGAAIVHLRRTIELKEDVFEAWQALATLEQRYLQQLAANAPERAEKRLAELEKIHERAMKLWTDRPIRPGLPEAFFTVAEGLYHVGEVDRAEALLQRSLVIEPVPDSLDLLGTIALKRSRLDQAESRYQDLASLAYESEAAQLRWEARARQQLGEIALRRGDAGGSTRHMRMALRHTNDLLARPAAGSGDRAARYVERGKLLFLLGDTALAMEDFRKASEISPGSVKAYADPLRCVVAYGYYDEARAIFRRAMSQDALSESLKLYFAIWMNDLALRSGERPEPEAASFLEAYRGEGWDEQLARHARGEMDFDALLAAASDRGEKAEAFFYEGLRQWRTGHATEGKRMMKQVLQTQMMGFFEYDMAQAYLDWGAPPKTARRPLTATAATKAKR